MAVTNGTCPILPMQKKGGSGVPFEPETRKIWTNAIDVFTPFVPNDFGRAVKFDTVTFTGYKETLWRWRDDFQNDFAARMDWCVSDYEDANHPPVPVLSNEEITVKSGEGIGLDAGSSYDPDGDNLSFLWFCYPEAGTLKKKIITTAENSHGLWVIAPKVEKMETTHIILRVTDKGTPQLSRYKRVIVNILPK